MKKYELIKGDYGFNDAFTNFYNTHRDDVLISDGDIFNDENDLIKNHLLLVFKTTIPCKFMYISKELLNCENDVIKIINEL